jgi:hypothetical protein
MASVNRVSRVAAQLDALGINLTPLLLCVDNGGVRSKHASQDDAPKITLCFPVSTFMAGHCSSPGVARHFNTTHL